MNLKELILNTINNSTQVSARNASGLGWVRPVTMPNPPAWNREKIEKIVET